MSASPSHQTTTELGGGFISVDRHGYGDAILVPRLAAAGVIGVMSSRSVNARNESELHTWLQRVGFSSDLPLAQVNQVHGATIVPCTAATPFVPGTEIDADGMWSQETHLILAIKAADCAPVWLADTASRRFALIHAGWRGVAAGIVRSAIETLGRQGSEAKNLTVAIGPHLGPCCFEVGPEVSDLFAQSPGAALPASRLRVERRRDHSFALDLSCALHAQLGELGVRAEQIFAATACTRCNPDLFHSYRRNGAGGPLMAAVAARKQ